MIFKLLKTGDPITPSAAIRVPDIGMCVACDPQPAIGSAADLSTWLAEARAASRPGTLLVQPHIPAISQAGDEHTYYALDHRGNIIAAITE